MNFTVIQKDEQSKARAGLLLTGHGIIETPIFMPVGTAGTVKAVHQHELNMDIGAQIILGNSYHLYLRPGLDVLRNAGGLHQFMNWQKPILTDSGGYQIFSLAANRKMTEEGAMFRSHIDGSKHHFTPENVVDLQRVIGSDIMMALDECTPYPATHAEAKKSMQLTHRWLQRGHKRYTETAELYGHKQMWFPIIQGSTFEDLRIESASFCAQYATNGIAIGGLSVGEPTDEMYAMIDTVEPYLPQNQPRYLMGVGTPANILEGIERGIDMFDCVMPTRNARNGMLFTSEGIINIKNERWKNDFQELDSNGTSYVDKCYSKAYLRHLFISGERLGAQIASIHNLAFYLWLVGEARVQIQQGTFSTWKKEMMEKVTARL